LDPGKALSLTDKAFDLAKGMTMKVNNIPVTTKRSIKTEYDENNIKRKKEDDTTVVKEEALSMGQVSTYFVFFLDCVLIIHYFVHL
jgi:hypothetical protein